MRVNSKVVSDIETGEILRRVAHNYHGAIHKLMGVSRMLGYQSTTVIASPAAAAETVVATVSGINPPVDSDTILILAFLALTVGTNGVSTQLKIRQGTTTAGASVGDSGALTATAANLVAPVILAVDTPGAVDNFSYSVTLTVASGSATSTVSKVAMFVLCL